MFKIISNKKKLNNINKVIKDRTGELYNINEIVENINKNIEIKKNEFNTITENIKIKKNEFNIITENIKIKKNEFDTITENINKLYKRLKNLENDIIIKDEILIRKTKELENAERWNKLINILDEYIDDKKIKFKINDKLFSIKRSKLNTFKFLEGIVFFNEQNNIEKPINIDINENIFSIIISWLNYPSLFKVNSNYIKTIKDHELDELILVTDEYLCDNEIFKKERHKRQERKKKLELEKQKIKKKLELENKLYIYEKNYLKHKNENNKLLQNILTDKYNDIDKYWNEYYQREYNNGHCIIGKFNYKYHTRRNTHGYKYQNNLCFYCKKVKEHYSFLMENVLHFEYNCIMKLKSEIEDLN